MNYYNEHDERAAAWLQALIDERHIPNGRIDTRSIHEVTAGDLVGFTQCHFFAGIGGWPLALKLAGWPESRTVWTGSCPCQPFSDAGAGRGTDDPRHLWPVWRPLIRESAPAIVFGEQVASKAALGWLDGVFVDLEGAGYACAAADLCAAGVGAPHIRQRLFWVGVSDGLADAFAERPFGRNGSERNADGGAGPRADAKRRREVGRLEHAGSDGFSGSGERIGAPLESELETPRRADIDGPGAFGGVADVLGAGLEGHAGHGDDGHEPGRLDPVAAGSTPAGGGAWDRFDLLPCRDGKTRRVESGTFPLAHGVSGRAGLLRGYGNAIVPEAAAEFIRAAVMAIEGVK